MMARAPGLIKVRGPTSFRNCPREDSSKEWVVFVISSSCCVTDRSIQERQRKSTFSLRQLWSPSRGHTTKNSASFSDQRCFFHYEASRLTSFGDGPFSFALRSHFVCAWGFRLHYAYFVITVVYS